MKIIHIVPSLVKGSGVTEMLYQINKNCNSKKFKNYFLLWDNTEKLNLKKNIILKKNINSFFILFFYLKYIRTQFYKKEQVHFIQHGLWHPIYLYTSIILRFFNLKYSVVSHGMLMREALKIKKFKKKIAFFIYQKIILKKAKNIIFTNNYERKESFNFLDNNINNYKIVNVRTKILNKKLTKKFTQKIVSFSRIHPIKSFEDFIYHWDTKRMIGWKWEIYGPIDDHKYYKYLKILLKKLNLNHNIVFKKAVYDKKRKFEIFNRSSFLLQTSKSESFNFSVSESLSLGVPVIVTKNSPWQIVQDKKLGYMYDNSSKSIKKVIDALSNLDNDQYNDIIYNFSNNTVSFSWDSFLKKIIY